MWQQTLAALALLLAGLLCLMSGWAWLGVALLLAAMYVAWQGR
jgi:hypothetical protein